MSDRRRWLVLAAVVPLGLFAALPGCGGGPDGTWPEGTKPKVVVSFAPLYSFALNVAGDDAVVKNIMTTDGPHDFNPTDADARLLRRADLFLINGLKLDNDLAAKLQKNSGNATLKVVDLGSRIPERQLLVAEHDHDHGHHHDHHHDHDRDPHVWLGPDQAVVMVEGIRDALAAADPAHADGYAKRAAEYVETLKKLKADGLELLKDKGDRKLVTFHESLGYFGEAFQLRIVGSVQKKPGVEPNAQELADLLKVCRGGKVRLIAVEPQYTAHTSAKTVLDELRRNGVPDAELVEIDPLETAQPAALTAGWYESRMRANLQALAAKMK